MDLLALNPVQWAQQMIEEDTPCDLIFLMTIKDIKMVRCQVTGCTWEDKDFGKKKIHEYDVHGIGQAAKSDICGRKFDNWRSFTRHQTTCGREKNKKFPECRKTYKDFERLTKPMEEVHAGKGYSPQVFDKCGKVL